MDQNSSESPSFEEPPSNVRKQQVICVNSGNPFIVESVSEWKKILKKSISSPREISKFFSIPIDIVNNICSKYPACINPYYISLIKEKDDAIYKQCVPSEKEITDLQGEDDPLCEEPEHQLRKDVPSLITHRYPDRILFRISNQCAIYCRFCTRKRKVGDSTKNPTWSEVIKGLNYIRQHEEIRDVLLSGGDPLMLNNKTIEKIISSVYEIIKKRANSIIRIGTRIPCVLPQRITPELCSMLQKYHPIYINTHFNHPDEITEQSKKACEMLANSGIPLGCQTVLLKGVNDSPEIMKELMQKLVSIRVRPYYIYQADPVKGTNHFRTKVEKGLEIYSKIRGFTSGLCVPAFVIDAPGGGGKIPLLPEYLQSIDKDKVILKNYEGKICEYSQV